MMEALITSRKKSIPFRLAFLAAGVLVFVAAYSIGAAMQLPAADAEAIRSGFQSQVDGIDEAGIFLNNIAVALGMFVPGAGVGGGVYSGVSTGQVYNAFAQDNPALAQVSPLSVLATPFGILELLAYGLGISRSGMLVVQLAKRRREWRQFALYTAVEIGIAVAALVAGSLVESQAKVGPGTKDALDTRA